MRLFGAKKQLNLKESLKKAKENLDGKMSSAQSTVTSSSGIGEVLDKHNEITGSLPTDPDGTATTSEIAQEELGDYLGVQPVAVTLTREQFNQGVRIHNAEVRAEGHPSQVIEPIWRENSVIMNMGTGKGTKFTRFRATTVLRCRHHRLRVTGEVRFPSRRRHRGRGFSPLCHLRIMREALWGYL